MKPVRGMTMVELLIAIAIMAVLAGLGYPVITSMVARARAAGCHSNLRSLGIAMEGYLQDHQQQMPTWQVGRSSKRGTDQVMEIGLLPYVDSTEVFHCPADSKQFRKTGSSYFWNSTQNGLTPSKLAFFGAKNRPDLIPLISDKEAWHPNETTHFLYADSSSSNRLRYTVNP